MNKPLEFKIEETNTGEVITGFVMVFYYENGATEKIALGFKPMGLELNKHYFIGDLYGEPVVDDRKGL